MSKARLVITAVVLEGRSQAEVARTYGVSPGWVSKLTARYREEGEAAFEPRSRRPKSSHNALSAAVVDLIVELRKELASAGLDAGTDTIRWHLLHHHDTKVAGATISRHLTKAGLVTAAPQKRPRSSYIRFAAEQPNECWQSDFTHYNVAGPAGSNLLESEIITWLDDHSRFALSVSAHVRITGPIVVGTFRKCTAEHGIPASTLTDNGMVYTTRLSGGKGGRNGFESELHRLHVVQKNSRPNHPTTCGKVERFQQTMKKWLRAQPRQPRTIRELQALIDLFVEYYNHSGRTARSLIRATLQWPMAPARRPPSEHLPRSPTTGFGAIVSTRAAK
jgi:transposase InsO family protein